MLKVKQQSVKFPANDTGGSTLTYPVFSEQYQQTSDGGGTWIADDPTDEYTDWPANESWSKFSKCVGGSSRCYVSDSNALRPGAYPRSGYVVILNGTSSDMLDTVGRLRLAGFLDPNATRAVFVEFAAYLTSRRLFLIATVLFEAEVGAVWPSSVVRLNALRLTATVASQVMDVVVYGFAMGVLLPIDIYTLYRLRWQYFRNTWHLLRYRGRLESDWSQMIVEHETVPSSLLSGRRRLEGYRRPSNCGRRLLRRTALGGAARSRFGEIGIAKAWIGLQRH